MAEATQGKDPAIGEAPAGELDPRAKSSSQRSSSSAWSQPRSSALGAVPRRRGRSPRPAPSSSPAPVDPDLAQTQTLTLSAWDLARTRTQLPDSPRGQVMTLRSHQRLVASFEKVREIPDPDRSVLRVKEDAKGSCLLIHGVSTRPGDLA